MTSAIPRVSALSALFFLAVPVVAQDSRLALFDGYNSARTYDAIKPLVSGVLAQQYALVASRDPGRVQEILARQQLASFRPRIVEIDGTNSFLVLENVRPKQGSDTGSQAYLLTRRAGGQWSLANRMLPDSVLKSLWTRHFDPAEFIQPASCAIDGRQISTRTALAVRRGDSIEIKLYPFEFSQADLDYWRRASGLPADGPTAGSHFDGRIPTVCRLVVKMSVAGRPSLVNVGFDDEAGAPARSTLWQTPVGDVSAIVFDHDVISLATTGAVGRDRNGFRWNVKIKVPVWQQGL